MNEHARNKTYAGAVVEIMVQPGDTACVHVHVSGVEDPADSGRLSPAEARDVAQHLLQAASVAEYNARTKKSEGT